MGILERTKNAWNAFTNRDQRKIGEDLIYAGSSYTPQYKQEKWNRSSIIDTILTQIAMDVSMIDFKQVKKDKDPTTEETVDNGLNNVLTLEANIDQSAIDFKQDIVFSMFDEGVVAVVPVDIDTKNDPDEYESYDILTMRVGKIVEWYPYHVRVSVYNEKTGRKEQMLVPKKSAAIIENPLYSVINADNATLKRLIRKLQLLDVFDEKIASNKLDLILQMPYSIKTEAQEARANTRVENIEKQLANSKYGIAYIDSTEHITQLNRAVENNLLKEIEFLTDQLFNQLGMTKNVFNGTASEQELRSYYDRTITPIAKRIALEFKRKFLTKTARTQGHDIVYHLNPFSSVPISAVGSMADTLRRNQILTTNEIRDIIGFQPSDDPQADELFNPNMPMADQMGGAMPQEDQPMYVDENGNEINVHEDENGNLVDDQGNIMEVEEEETEMQ